MTIQIFLILLTIFATLTSLCTEGIKKFLDGINVNYASNFVVLAAAALVGGIGTPVYYILAGLGWTAANIMCIPLMMVANWLGAMVGYDKVKQAILQLKVRKE